MREVVAEHVAVGVVRIRSQGLQYVDSHGFDIVMAANQCMWPTVLAITLNRSVSRREIAFT